MQDLKQYTEIHQHTGTRIFDINDGIPSLRGRDMGYGMTLFRLIRDTFDKKRFRMCLEMHKERGQLGLTSSRDITEFNHNLRVLRPNISRAEAKKISKAFGTLQSDNAHVIAAKSPDGGTWIAVYDGCPAVSALVTSGSSQCSPEDYLQKLALVSKLGAWNRVLFISRIFELYYGTGQIEEVVRRVYSTPYNHTANQKIAIGTAMPAPSQEFAVYSNGYILLLKNNTSFYTPVPEYTVPHRVNRRQPPIKNSICLGGGAILRIQPFFDFKKDWP